HLYKAKDTIRRNHRHPRTADPRCHAKFQNCRHGDLLLPILWEHHAGWHIPPAKVEPTGKTSRGKRGRGFFSFACASIAGEFRRRAYNCASSFRSSVSPDEYSFLRRLHAFVESSPSRAPCAAIAPAAVGLPLRIHSKITPISAPTAGPTRQIHVVPKFPRTKSGANDLAGFIEAPVIGAAQSPARAIYPPTAIAPLVPMLRAPEAVPRIVFTNPVVRSTSIAKAFRCLCHCLALSPQESSPLLSPECIP